MKLSIIPLRVLASILLAVVACIAWQHGPAAGAVAFVAGSLCVHSLRQHPTHRQGYVWAYTGVTLAEIFIPEVYADIIPEDSPETTAFVQSGVIAKNDLLTRAANSGTELIEVPIWDDLDASVEPNLSDDTDTKATPGKVGTRKLQARNAYLNKGYGSADLARELAKATPGNGDPMTRIKNRFGTYWMHQFQYRVIAAARGILADNIANDGGDMIHNIALETTVGVGAANKISADAVVEACFTMGDQFNSLAVIAVHSVVYKELVKQQLIEQFRDADGKLLYETYLGRRVVVDDGLPVIAGTTSGLKYLSILFGAGSFGYGEGTPTLPTEIERLASSGNGGGLENIWERKTWMIHAAGMDWKEASVAGQSATLAELRNAANWDRKFARKNVKLAFLQTNG